MTQVWPPADDDDWWDEGWDGSDCTDPACPCRDADYWEDAPSDTQ